MLDQLSLKDIAEWNPWQKGLKRFEALSDQTLFDALRIGYGFFDDELAKLENGTELSDHGFLELLCLILQQSWFAEVKYFLTQKLQDIEHVFTFSLALLCSATNVWDEIVPIHRPFLFHDAHQSSIEFGQKMLILSRGLLIFSHRQNELNYALSDSKFLFVR